MPNLVTGPSSSQTPYLVNLEPNIRFTSIITTGDTVAGAATLPDGGAWRFGGIPDGIGAFDSGDGTITVLVNHEIFLGATTATVERAHGAAGAYVSAVVVDAATLRVVDAYDLADTMYTDANGDGVWTLEADNIDRLCSADLAPVSAYFWTGADGVAGTADDLGTAERIFLNGEEFGAEGRAFGWVATGAEARTVWELPSLGHFSWENAVANGSSGKATVVVGTDDSTPGQVYVYVGEKQATGNTIQKAGLSGGTLYGIKADGIGAGSTAENAQFVNGVPTTPTSGNFTLVAIPNAATSTGATIDATSDSLGVTEWWRPEDAAWDTVNPNRLYFATTAGVSVVNGVTQPSRLWALDFADVKDPTQGGTFTMVLDGTEGHFMFDNLTVDADGKVWLVEDIGGNARSGRTWVYDPATDESYEVAKHDVTRFGDGPANSTQTGIPTILPAAPFNNNEEASGILDVTHLLGDSDTQAFLIDVQAHYDISNDPRYTDGLAGTPSVTEARARAELVEGGQLLVMYVDEVKDGRRGDDALNGSYEAEEIRGKGGNDLIRGGSGADSLKGGNGNDTIVGGAGADELRGAAGADIFRYMAASEGGDEIKGFSVAEDGLEVSAAGFGGGLAAGALAAARFVSGRDVVATEAFGQFLYDTREGELSWDADGTGAGAAVLIADFGGRPALTAADIAVIA